MKKIIALLIILSFVGCTGAGITSDKVVDKTFLNKKLLIEERVGSLLSQMTLEEKIGQMIQAERGNIKEGEIKKYGLGSVLSGGGSGPSYNNIESWRNMIIDFQEEALSTRLGIPILYGIDAVHGNNNVMGSTIFPHNIGLGAARDPELMKKIGEIIAIEMTEMGAKWNFSPCVAVSTDPRWGRTYESFGESPDLQELLVGSYIKGMQGDKNEKYMSDSNVVSTAKHYVADGAAKWGTGDNGYNIDRGNAEITEEELRKIHLIGYKKAIEENVGTIMASFSSWNGVKMHEHDYLINEVLKKELGFDGLVVSDWEAISEISGKNYYEKVVKATNAGIDMFMEPNRWRDVYKYLGEAVKKGDIEEERINDAVSRILRIKFMSGVIDNPYPTKIDKLSTGSKEHREVAREAVRKSLVLLKNENNILPLSKDAKIFVGGSCADNIGYQSGGWTITWQGGSDDGNNRRILGTSILEGIQEEISDKGSIEKNPEEADVAIIVTGERPYAEGKGDVWNLELFKGKSFKEDKDIISKMKELGKPVIVILISGRPLIITNEIPHWDGVVAAWLLGSEGNGVSDVLFGDYNFTGKLPISWPSSMEEIELNVTDEDYNEKDLLFKYGHGLSY